MVIGSFFPGGVAGWLISSFGCGFLFMGAVFVWLILFQLLLAMIGMKRETPYALQDAKLVDLTPWKPAPYVGGLMILFAVGVYVYFAT